jgi:hypothetical protein
MPVINEKSKSAHGNSFKDIVLLLLKDLKQEGIIDNMEIEKKIGQFFVPFFLHISGRGVALSTTTSARSDRVKEDQWDAWGIKNKLGNQVKYVLLLPNELSEREVNNYKKEQARISQTNYISMIDSIIQLNDLREYLNSLNT